MARATYVCATCSEHFTRRYSATRHNLTIHNGRGEIVTYLEYLVGRNSGRYQPSHPSLYRRGRGEKSEIVLDDLPNISNIYLKSVLSLRLAPPKFASVNLSPLKFAFF